MITLKGQTNAEEVIRWYEERLPKRAEHVLLVLNEAPYAAYLEARVGYWVMNDHVAQRIVWAELAQAITSANARGEVVSDRDVVQALDVAGDEIVAYYQQVVGYKGDRGAERPPPRPQHPGQWADDTLELVRSYLTAVDDGPERRYPYAS